MWVSNNRNDTSTSNGIAEPYARYELKANTTEGRRNDTCDHNLCPEAGKEKNKIIKPYRTVWLMSPAGSNAVRVKR